MDSRVIFEFLVLIEGFVRLAGWAEPSWPAHSQKHCSRPDRTVFFSHTNQPEQYFSLFFSPAEQAQELLLRLLPLPRPQGRDGGREADGAAGVAVKAAAAGGGAGGGVGAPRGAVKAVAKVDAGSSDSSKVSSD